MGANFNHKQTFCRENKSKRFVGSALYTLTTSCEMVNLVGKVCLVTGATRGIGRGIAVQLAQTGATIYITGRKQATLDEVVKELLDRGATKAYGIQG